MACSFFSLLFFVRRSCKDVVGGYFCILILFDSTVCCFWCVNYHVFGCLSVVRRKGLCVVGDTPLGLWVVLSRWTRVLSLQ